MMTRHASLAGCIRAPASLAYSAGHGPRASVSVIRKWSLCAIRCHSKVIHPPSTCNILCSLSFTSTTRAHEKGGAACSLCPTFASVACFINNARWDGVPFLLKAGKALHTRRAEIRVQFRHVPGNLYRDRLGMDLDRVTNELVCVHN